jgi:hypothetical protein
MEVQIDSSCFHLYKINMTCKFEKDKAEFGKEVWN